MFPLWAKEGQLSGTNIPVIGEMVWESQSGKKGSVDPWASQVLGRLHLVFSLGTLFIKKLIDKNLLILKFI